MKELAQVLQLLLVNLTKQQMGNQQTATFQQKFKVEVLTGRLGWQVLAGWEGIARTNTGSYRAKSWGAYFFPASLSFPISSPQEQLFYIIYENLIAGIHSLSEAQGKSSAK